MGVVDLPDETAAFAEVMEALRRYADETGAEPLMLGGWEAEHPAIAPPPGLLPRMSERAFDLRRYTYASDLRRAREEAAELLADALRFAGAPLTGRHVSIQQNSTQALLLSLAALKERGAQRVVIAAPAYYAAETICRSLGLEVVIAPASDFLTGALDIPRLCAAARLPGSVALVTNPAYSLGVEYTPAQISALASDLPPHAWLLLDETRLGLHWRYPEPWYRAELSPRTIVIRSPSKIFFIHGRKISLLFGDPALLGEIERLGEALVGSLSGDAESVALAYLGAWRAWRDETAAGDTGPHTGAMLRWRAEILAVLRRNLATAQTALAPAGFQISPVHSGPYALAAAPRERLPRLAPMEAARQGVLLMDARYFLHEHPDWWGFRINLCCSSQHLSEALIRLQAVWRPAGQIAAITGSWQGA